MIAPQLAGLPLPLPERPYRGIDSFRLVDHPIFCAREQEVQKLFRAITIYRGVLLYGASGVGKSSLVNAGLLPEALAGGFSPERIRVQPRPGEEIIVERIPLTADAGPPYLPSLFAPSGDGESRVVLSAKDLPARLRMVREGVYPLLIFDQFEEFVTLFEEAPQAGRRDDAAAAQDTLLGVLTELLRDHSFQVKLLFAFREDYLAKLNKLFARHPTLTDQYLRVVPPGKSALPEIIRGPFEDEHLRQHFGKELPEPVVAELAREIDEHKQGGPINLSEVGIASLRLWESSDPAALLKRRHVQGLLEDYLAESLQRLGSLRDPAVALLSRMVTGRGTRNVVLEEDLLHRVGKEEKVPEERLRQALTGLERDTGLVRRERRNDAYFYEIVSEFLVPWIRGQKQDREQNMRFRRFLLWVVAVAALILLLLGGALFWRNSQNVVITAAEKEAREAREMAEMAQMEAEQEHEKAERWQGKAEAAVSELAAAKGQFQTREAALVSKLTLTQTESAQRERSLKDFQSRLASISSQQQQLASRLKQVQDSAETAQNQWSLCALNLEKAKGETESLQASVSSCREESRKAQATTTATLNDCLKKGKERCPSLYNSSEVSALFDQIQHDHHELDDELGDLKKKKSAAEAAHDLKQAIEYQKDAKEHFAKLRQLVMARPPGEP